MPKRLVVIITWLDGRTEEFEDCSQHVSDGVLTVSQFGHWWSRKPPQQWRFPLANIREFHAEWRKLPR